MEFVIYEQLLNKLYLAVCKHTDKYMLCSRLLYILYMATFASNNSAQKHAHMLLNDPNLYLVFKFIRLAPTHDGLSDLMTSPRPKQVQTFWA